MAKSERGSSATWVAPVGWALRIATLGLVLGVAMSYPSQLGVTVLAPVMSAAIILVVILIGVFADIVGVAATRANEKPFIARASKKVPGALAGLYLVRRADAVANIALDLIGDLAGTVSGALSAGLALRLTGEHSLLIVTAGAVGIVSALTIGSKAIAKTYAVRHADEVVSLVGRLLDGMGVRLARPRE